MLINDFRIPGKNLKVSGSLELRTEDIAGESCATDSVDKGIKPKILRVSVDIPFSAKDDLLNLVKKAEAKDRSGERAIYTVTHRTANAAGVRQVRFFEHFNWREDRRLLMWQVSFTLQEYLSNPERTENRETSDMTTDVTQYKTILDQTENIA
nr:hypothetical protein [uncultured Desulfobacter sp.]